MDKIQEIEFNNEKVEKVFNKIDPILSSIDDIIPGAWSKNQVASVFSVYLEIYK